MPYTHRIKCVDCATMFWPSQRPTGRCPDCQAVERRVRENAAARRRAADRRGSKECQYCGRTFNPPTARTPHCESEACRKAHNTARMRKYFEGYADRNGQSYVIKRNPETRQRDSAERRARKRGARVGEPFTRQYIGQRDSWQCALCSQPIDPTLKWPDPMSQSLEHIVPLALGGEHSKENCTIAHLSCNSRGGTRHAQARARMLRRLND